MSMRNIRIRKRVLLCCPGSDTDYIKDSFDVVNVSRGIIIHVKGNSSRNRDGSFERSKVLIKKFKELLVTAKKIGKKVGE